jgi:hypothetical protein
MSSVSVVAWVDFTTVVSITFFEEQTPISFLHRASRRTTIQTESGYLRLSPEDEIKFADLINVKIWISVSSFCQVVAFLEIKDPQVKLVEPVCVKPNGTPTRSLSCEIRTAILI